MSVTREVTIWCDGEGCSLWEQGPTPARLLRQDLYKRGWRQIRGRDLCRSCVTKEKGNEQKQQG
jgi:hypothetical protein